MAVVKKSFVTFQTSGAACKVPALSQCGLGARKGQGWRGQQHRERAAGQHKKGERITKENSFQRISQILAQEAEGGSSWLDIGS